MHSNLQLLLSALKNVKPTGQNRWQALCPAHDDKDPSLSVSLVDEGKVLVKCHAGCKGTEIMSALGLPMGVLFHPDSTYFKDRTGFARKIRKQSQLSAVARDAMIVAMAAAKIRNGEEVSSADISALIDVSARCQKAAEEAVL